MKISFEICIKFYRYEFAETHYMFLFIFALVKYHMIGIDNDKGSNPLFRDLVINQSLRQRARRGHVYMIMSLK